MIDTREYSSRYADQYRDRSFETIMVGVRRERVLASLREHGGRRILEIGCGLEPLFPHLAGWERYVIVEPSRDFATEARRLAADGPGEVAVVRGYFEEEHRRLPGRGGFDFVVLSSLLHEVPDPATLLGAVRGVCNDQTVVHINVPNVYSFHRLLAQEMGLIESIRDKSQTEIKFGRHTRFDRASLIGLVEAHGFRILSSGSYLIKPFSNEQMERIIAEGIVDRTVVDGLSRMVKYLPEMGCEIFVDVRRRESDGDGGQGATDGTR